MIGKIVCEDCMQESTIKGDYISDLIEQKCPKCGSENTWFKDIDSEEPFVPFKIPGKGGCGRTG